MYMHVWYYYLDKKIANGMAVPEIRSRRTSREQRDQPIVKYVYNIVVMAI